MDGGTMCSAEKGFTVRVPELRSSTTLAIARCEKHGKEVLCLDNAFSLIDGHPDFKVLNYVSDIKEIQIAGDWAIEVGSVQATYKLSAKDAPVNVNDKAMRLLKRQSDGSWKFALVGLK